MFKNTTLEEDDEDDNRSGNLNGLYSSNSRREGCDTPRFSVQVVPKKEEEKQGAEVAEYHD